ncbi:hypothetical protein HaLaN_22673, partial [Haematococcus lacustris]
RSIEAATRRSIEAATATVCNRRVQPQFVQVVNPQDKANAVSVPVLTCPRGDAVGACLFAAVFLFWSNCINNRSTPTVEGRKLGRCSTLGTSHTFVMPSQRTIYFPSAVPGAIGKEESASLLLTHWTHSCWALADDVLRGYNSSNMWEQQQLMGAWQG